MPGFNDDDAYTTTTVTAPSEMEMMALAATRRDAEVRLHQRRNTDPERTFTESAILEAVKQAGAPYPSSSLGVLLDKLGIKKTRRVIVAVPMEVPVGQEVNDGYLEDNLGLPIGLARESRIFDPQNGDDTFGVAAVKQTEDHAWILAGDVAFAPEN
jgi:hypothetical protein